MFDNANQPYKNKVLL